MKHNKKRNTAFIYETLCRELTKTVIGGDTVLRNKVSALIKEFFSPGCILATELRLYRALLETSRIDERVAERLLAETKKKHSALNEKEVFTAQSQLISAINKGLGTHVWSNFVPNFKVLASLNAIFNTNIDVKKRVLFEQALVDRMHSTPREEPATLEPLDSLAYRSFIKKFNEKYGDLLQEQKMLLNLYVTSFADDGLEFRLYLNEELTRLKEAVTTASSEETSALISEKMEATVAYLDGFRKRQLSDDDLKKLLTTQELVRELQHHA
jgi:hypothetical protein